MYQYAPSHNLDHIEWNHAHLIYPPNLAIPTSPVNPPATQPNQPVQMTIDFDSIIAPKLGARESISWNRNGIIASIGDEGVETNLLVCTDGQDWVLTKPTLYAPKSILQPPTTSFVTPHRAFCHVEWSPSGSDLAIIDTLGSLYIYSQYTTLSPITCLRKPPSEELTTPIDLNAIVGFTWVAPEKPVILTNPGLKAGGSEKSKQKLSDVKDFPTGQTSQLLGYSGISVTYGVSQGLHLGPRIPQGFGACIGVTRSQVLKLWTQNGPSQPYNLVKLSLNQLHSDDIISHASFAGTKDHKMLLACYSPAGAIYLYRIEVEWSKEEEPKLRATRLLKETLMPQSGAPARLTDLKLFSIRSNQVSSETEAEMVCVFTDTKGATTNRYELQSHTPDLNSTFYSLGTNDSSASSTTTHKTHIISLVETTTSNKIVNIGSQVYDSIFFAAHEDGILNFRYRGNVSSSTKGTPFNMFSDAGYAFTPLPKGSDRPDYICVSPTCASYVYKTKDGLKLRIIDNKIPDADLTVAQMVDSAFVLSLRHSVSCISAVCNDDVMMVMRREIQRVSKLAPALETQFPLLLLAESHKAINFSLDLKKDHQMDKIMINPSLQRLLTMQTVIGTQHGWTRNVTSRLSWCFLNLRLVSFSLTFTLRAIGQQKPGVAPNHAMRIHYLMSLSGLKRWCLDFAAYLCQELLAASNEGPSYFQKQHVALPMVMARSSRMLLMYSWRGIRSLDTILMQKPGTETQEAGLASQRQRELSHFTPISMTFFEQLFNVIDSHTKQVAENVEDRLGLEQQLLFQGMIPQQFLPLAKRCVDEFDKFRKTNDLSPLYFYNVSWLGLDEHYDGRPAPTPAMAPYRNVTSTGLKIDCLRKFIIERQEGSILRVCQRCAGTSVFVDSSDGKQFTGTHWTFAFQRNCWCGGMWIPESLGV
ncbi:YALIA101S02e06260g1_1 [Yarrowia lipolytica]|nr:YALIA101S02e06260g1_1 [Yarrowia lipolytica]